MIVVNVMMETTSEQIAGVKDAIAAMETASRAEEGCEDYTFSVELNNPNRIRITERWTSMEALAAHFQMPHMASFLEALAGVTFTARDTNFYEATPVDPPR